MCTFRFLRSVLPQSTLAHSPTETVSYLHHKESIMSTHPLLDVRSVTLRYKTDGGLVTATSRVSFNVNTGDRYVLLGPSGCGKSTLLKAVVGYLQPAEGQLLLKGEAIRKPGPDRM